MAWWRDFIEREGVAARAAGFTILTAVLRRMGRGDIPIIAKLERTQ